jgi:hypothetical protein
MPVRAMTSNRNETTKLSIQAVESGASIASTIVATKGAFPMKSAKRAAT